MKLATALLLSLTLMIAGCKATKVSTPPPPGAVNAMDETLYQSLSAAQAALNSLKASEPTTPQIKPALNQAINAYDLAEVAYQTFHAALVAGQNPDPTPVLNAITTVQNDLSVIQGGK